MADKKKKKDGMSDQTAVALTSLIPAVIGMIAGEPAAGFGAASEQFNQGQNRILQKQLQEQKFAQQNALQKQGFRQDMFKMGVQQEAAGEIQGQKNLAALQGKQLGHIQDIDLENLKQKGRKELAGIVSPTKMQQAPTLVIKGTNQPPMWHPKKGYGIMNKGKWTPLSPDKIENSVATRFAQTHGMKGEKFRKEIMDSYGKDPDISAYRTFKNTEDKLRPLISSGNKMAAGSLKTQFPRLMGEVGALTEGDKEPFAGASDVVSRMKRLWAKNTTSELLESDIKEFNNLLDVLKEGSTKSFKRGHQRQVMSLAAIKDWKPEQAAGFLESMESVELGNREKMKKEQGSFDPSQAGSAKTPEQKAARRQFLLNKAKGN